MPFPHIPMSKGLLKKQVESAFTEADLFSNDSKHECHCNAAGKYIKWYCT